MRKLIALTRIQLKDFFSKYTQQLNVRNRFLGRLVALLPILIFLPAFLMIQQLHGTFVLSGYPELLVTYLYVGVTTLAFLMALPLILSVFFYAKDLSLLATLPVKEDTIVFAKLSTIYAYLLAISALLLGTGVGFYALADGIKPIGLIMGILVTLALPILPMVIATLLIMPFMTWIGGRSNRNLMILAGNVILLALIISLQLLFTRVQMDPEAVQRILASEDGLLYLLGRGFPPSVWATRMVRGSLLDTVYFLLLNFGFLLVLKGLAKGLYRKALLKYNQQNTTRGRQKALTFKSRSKKHLLIRRHIGIIFHNPTFTLNTVMTLFVPLLIFGIYALMGVMDLETLRGPMVAPFAPYLFTGIIVSPSFMGSLSATVISREGKTFWETRVLPITARENLSARIQSTILINGIATLVLALVTFWVLPLTPLQIAIALLTAALATLCFATIDIIINIERPSLNWSSPTAAVKNNLNVMLSLVSRLVIGGAGYLLYLVLPDPTPAWVLLAVSGLLLVVYVIGRYLVYGPYEKKFIRMDL